MAQPFNLFGIPPDRHCDPCRPCDPCKPHHDVCEPPTGQVVVDSVPEQGSENPVTGGGVWQSIQDAIAQIELITGQLVNLTTLDKSNLVAAINEVNSKITLVTNNTSEYSVILGAPIIVSGGELVLAGDTRTWQVQADGVLLPGQFNGSRTYYPFTTANPQQVTVRNAVGNIAYQWNKPAIPPVSYNDVLDRPKINGIELVGDKSASVLGLATPDQVNAKYTLPAGGIPMGDLATAVQDRLVPTGGNTDSVLTRNMDGTASFRSWVVQPDVKHVDTNAIQLIGTGQDQDRLQALLLKAPATGGVENALMIQMNGAFVPTITTGTTSTVNLYKDAQSKITGEVRVSAVSNNTLEVDPNGGLYVPPFVPDLGYVDDTATISHTGDGSYTAPLKLNVNVSAESGNGIVPKTDGLYMSNVLAVSANPTASINVTGNGTPATPFAWTVRRSTTYSDNRLQEDSLGLYVLPENGITQVTTDNAGATVTLTGVGTAASPLKGMVKIKSGTNPLTYDADGLYVTLPEYGKVSTDNTTSVTLTGTGLLDNKLKANVAISTQEGNAATIRTGTNPGLYVPTSIATVSVDNTSNGVNFTGNGLSSNPLKVSLVIDPDTNNALVNGTSGLFVDSIASVDTENTAEVALSGSGLATDKLKANITLSAASGNALSIKPSTDANPGLYVSTVGAPAFGDSTSVDMSGTGTSADPIIAEARLSADTGNALSIKPSTDTNPGLFVPTVTPGIGDAPSDHFTYARKNGAWVSTDSEYVGRYNFSTDTVVYAHLGMDEGQTDSLISATADPDVKAIVRRSNTGTAQVEAPVNAKDIANKTYADARQTAAESFATSAIATHNSAADAHPLLRAEIAAAANSGLPWTNAYWYALPSGSPQPAARGTDSTPIPGQNYIDMSTNPPNVYTVDVTTGNWVLSGQDNVANGRPVLITKKIWNIAESDNEGGKVYRTGDTSWIISPDLTGHSVPDGTTIVRNSVGNLAVGTIGISNTAGDIAGVADLGTFMFSAIDDGSLVPISDAQWTLLHDANIQLFKVRFQDDGDATKFYDALFRRSETVSAASSMYGADLTVLETSAALWYDGLSARVVFGMRIAVGLDDSDTPQKVASIVTYFMPEFPIGAGNIQNGAITSAKLASNAVTQIKMADSSVGTPELINASVTTAKLADESVTSVKLVDSSVTPAKIADGSVTSLKLADNAVTTNSIAVNTSVRDVTVTGAVIRNIQISTTDLTAGTSALTTGSIYLVYE